MENDNNIRAPITILIGINRYEKMNPDHDFQVIQFLAVVKVFNNDQVLAKERSKKSGKQDYNYKTEIYNGFFLIKTHLNINPNLPFEPFIRKLAQVNVEQTCYELLGMTMCDKSFELLLWFLDEYKINLRTLSSTNIVNMRPKGSDQMSASLLGKFYEEIQWRGFDMYYGNFGSQTCIRSSRSLTCKLGIVIRRIVPDISSWKAIQLLCTKPILPMDIIRLISDFLYNEKINNTDDPSICYTD